MPPSDSSSSLRKVYKVSNREAIQNRESNAERTQLEGLITTHATTIYRFASNSACLACLCTHATLAWCLSLVTLLMLEKLRHQHRQCLSGGWQLTHPTGDISPQTFVENTRVGVGMDKLAGSRCRGQVFDLLSCRW